jgi:hypothetical protein
VLHLSEDSIGNMHKRRINACMKVVWLMGRRGKVAVTDSRLLNLRLLRINRLLAGNVVTLPIPDLDGACAVFFAQTDLSTTVQRTPPCLAEAAPLDREVKQRT